MYMAHLPLTPDDKTRPPVPRPPSWPAAAGRSSSAPRWRPQKPSRLCGKDAKTLGKPGKNVGKTWEKTMEKNMENH